MLSTASSGAFRWGNVASRRLRIAHQPRVSVYSPPAPHATEAAPDLRAADAKRPSSSRREATLGVNCWPGSNKTSQIFGPSCERAINVALHLVEQPLDQQQSAVNLALLAPEALRDGGWGEPVYAIERANSQPSSNSVRPCPRRSMATWTLASAMSTSQRRASSFGHCSRRAAQSAATARVFASWAWGPFALIS